MFSISPFKWLMREEDSDGVSITAKVNKSTARVFKTCGHE